jgi:hypothetical protein
VKENQDGYNFKSILDFAILALGSKYSVCFLRIFLQFGRKGNAAAEMKQEVRGVISGRISMRWGEGGGLYPYT